MSQQPLPQATQMSSPTMGLPNTQQGQNAGSNRPDISRPYRGWYPRWWLLSAFFSSLMIGIWTLVGHFACGPTNANALICQVQAWSDWRICLPVVAVWVLFLLGWLVAFMLGTGPLEISKQKDNPITNFLRVVSDFQPIYSMLLFLGGIAFASIVVIWFFEIFQPLTFALATLLLFVANSCFLYKLHPTERRNYVIGYGVLALVFILMMFLFKRVEFVILTSELIVVAFAIINLRPVKASAQQTGGAAGPDPNAVLANDIANTTTPGQLFQDLFQTGARKRNAQNTAAPTVQDPMATQAGQTTQNIANQPTQTFGSQSTQNIANQPTQIFGNPLTQNTGAQPTQTFVNPLTQNTGDEPTQPLVNPSTQNTTTQSFP